MSLRIRSLFSARQSCGYKIRTMKKANTNGATSPYSLYNESLASFTTGDLYDHHDAEGFINLFGLSSKVRAMKMQEVEKNNN